MTPHFASGEGLAPGAELLLLLFILTIFASVGALIAAFFSRWGARVLAASAVLAIVSSALLLSSANHSSVIEALIRLFSRWPFSGVFAVALTLSGIAAFVPLAPGPTQDTIRRGTPSPSSDVEAERCAQGRGQVTRNRICVLLLVGVPLLLLAGTLVWRYLDHWADERMFIALLNGDESIHLEEFSVEDCVFCVDPTVLRYLEECFRHRDPEIKPGEVIRYGVSTAVTLKFAGGRSYTFEVTMIKDGLLFDHPGQRHFDQWKTHPVRFKNPRPAAVDAMARFLRFDSKELEGSAMLIESGGVRYLKRSLP